MCNKIDIFMDSLKFLNFAFLSSRLNKVEGIEKTAESWEGLHESDEFR